MRREETEAGSRHRLLNHDAVTRSGAEVLSPRMARLHAWLHEATGPAPLVAFRIGFGLLMMGAALRFWSKGWIRTHFIEPDFHFRYFLFGWIPELPGDWLYLVFAVQIASAALIALGWRYRIAAVLFFLSFTYVELIDQATYLNHYYFISLVSFLLILLPLDRWGSLDARARRPGPDPAPRWIALVLQAQIAVVYFFAGLAKLNPDWLLEAQPLGIWLSARSGLPVLGVLFDQPWFAYLMSWGGAAFDLCIPFLLLWRVTRPGAYGAVVVFHLATAVLFPIGVFPWVMIASTLIFFDERDWRRFGGWLPGKRRHRSPDRTTLDAPGASRPPSAAACPLGRGRGLVLGAFFALQVLVPLRHLAYPGNVLWTEEGFRFSWRVMLVEKTGAVFFEVTDPDRDRSWEVFPGDYLTPLQERQFAFQPDMILALAHHLRDTLRDQGVRRPEVRVRAYVSLNGRRSRPLIDPTVDLARVPRSLARKDWVLALDAP